MSTSRVRFVLALGLIAAIGPASIDMYLPTFPSIAANLNTTGSAVQFTMVSYFLATAVGQLVYGPVSDLTGRKPPLYAGLVLFLIGAVGCALAPNIATLIGVRFIQGFGACSGMVMARAIIRDRFQGADAVRLLSGILLVIIVSPILAPLAGSTIASVLSWRWVFGVVSIVGLVALASAIWFTPESLPPEGRQPLNLSGVLTNYGRLLRDRRFLALVMLGAFSQGQLYAYISAASLVFIKSYRLAPGAFSVIFAVNAIAMIGVAQFNAPLVRRFGGARVVAFGCSATAVFLAPLAVLATLGLLTLPVLLVLLFLAFAALGTINGPNTVMALEAQHEAVGTASSLMGATQFAVGAAIAGIVGLTPGPPERGLFLVMMACSAVALTIAFKTLTPEVRRAGTQ